MSINDNSIIYAEFLSLSQLEKTIKKCNEVKMIDNCNTQLDVTVIGNYP